MIAARDTLVRSSEEPVDSLDEIGEQPGFFDDQDVHDVVRRIATPKGACCFTSCRGCAAPSTSTQAIDAKWLLTTDSPRAPRARDTGTSDCRVRSRRSLACRSLG